MPKAKVLVVEDESITAKEIQKSLERLGYLVSAVTDNGLDAINLAKQTNPDLVLMDIVLKGPIDGIKASAKINEFRKIPVVYLTAHQDEETLERSKQTNPYGYLLKPLNERDLNSCLRMALFRHESEKKLRESEERFNALTEVALSAIIIISGDKFIYANPHAEALTGYNFNELKEMNFWDVVHPDFKEMVKQRGLARQRGENVPTSYEFKIVTKSGEEKWVQTSATLTDYEGKKCTLAIVFDITERKKAEEILKQSEEKFRAVSESTPAQIVIFQGTKFVYVNPYSEIMSGYSKDELLKFNFWDLVHPEYKELARQRGLARQNGEDVPSNYELKIITKSGEQKWLDYSAKLIDYNGKPAVLGISVDITARKKIEQRLQQSLSEKEILLKEIHHRVKNNLQIVTSLLKLQSSYVDDEKVKQLFKESQNRVQSMALIHQKLYQTKDLSHIDFKEYIETLALYLQHSYGVLEDKVKIIIDVKNLEMPIDNAIPAGLIINELISNSLKYAFPNGQTGKIFINLAFDDFEKEYWLSVRDTGIGIPENFDFKNANTFGLKLVTTLAGQMGGTIELVSAGGCEFRITFKSSDYKERK